MKEKVCLFMVMAAQLLLIGCAALPATGTAAVASWQFVVLSDTRSDPCAADGKSGVNSGILERIAGAVANEKPDLVLVPGDLVLGNAYKCTTANPFATQLQSWRTAMKPVYDANIPVLPVRGNHELLSKDYFPTEPCRPLTPDPAALQTWLEIFGRDVPQNGPAGEQGLTYALPHKNAVFIGLDEISDYLSYNPSWFDAMLKTDKRQHLFVYGHFPAFGVQHPDNLSCNIAMRDALLKAIYTNNGRLYFCGHDHLYDRGEISDPAGISLVQVLVGNGGAPYNYYSGEYADKRMKPQKRVLGKPGYLLVTVNGAEISAELKILEDDKISIADRFGYTLH